MTSCWQALSCCAAALLLVACSSTTVKTTQVTPLAYTTETLPEAVLLDVGVTIFEPGLEQLEEDKDGITGPEIRRAEARYFPHMLTETLQRNGSWGAVRMVPDASVLVDVYVEGKILHSDGERLELQVKVSDSSGRQWFVKEYKELASKYSYARSTSVEQEPFQSVYNQIANDMLVFRDRLALEQQQRLRTITELKFASSFSPVAFDGYLRQDRRGYFEVERLPPSNDPLLQRVHQIRERDYLFIDTLQDYYSSFALEMERPYHEWRKMTYDEVIALREVRRESRNQMLAGAAGVIGGILAAGSDNRSVRAAGPVGIIGGAYAIKSGLGKRAESQMHIEALQELGESLELEVEPRVMNLDDRTVTLTGTVNDQYGQWKEILREIYSTETGLPTAQ